METPFMLYALARTALLLLKVALLHLPRNKRSQSSSHSNVSLSLPSPQPPVRPPYLALVILLVATLPLLVGWEPLEALAVAKCPTWTQNLCVKWWTLPSCRTSWETQVDSQRTPIILTVKIYIYIIYLYRLCSLHHYEQSSNEGHDWAESWIRACH
jgi:hypothetical protein